MTAFLMTAALVLLINAGVSLWRMVRVRAAAEHVLPLQLVGTNTIAILLLLSEAMDQPAALDIAFIFAILAALTPLAFAHRLWWRLPSRSRR